MKENMLFSKKEIIDHKYEVLFPIHKTTYGESYRVKGVSDEKLYMLKIYRTEQLMPFHFNADNELLEANIHSQIHHPNIAEYVEHKAISISGTNYIYYVVAFISGETLQERIDRTGAPSYLFCIKIIEKIGDALNYLHSQHPSIIHGDVTPLNIMLDYAADGNPVLFDFGLSYFSNSKEAHFNRTSPSVYFASPEQLEGTTSISSDIFSFGGLIYYMISGNYPWADQIKNIDVNSDLFLSELQAARMDSLSFSPSLNIDQQIKRAVTKSMMNEPVNRFKTIEIFIDSLKGKLEIGPDEINIEKVKNLSALKKGQGFKRIAGMQQLKDDIQQELIEPLLNPESVEAYGIEPPNGVLFYGPPGCGKTFFAECLADEVGFNFVKIGPSDVGSTYVHGGQEKIKKLFEDAKENAPTILFIDEIDAMLPDRSSNKLEHHYASEVNEWLVQINNSTKHKIFIIGATNRVEKIDKAILRSGRFDRKIFIPLPDDQLRIELFKIELEKRKKVLDEDIDYNALSLATKGYVSSDIVLICMDASRQAYRQKCKISQQILLEIIKNSTSSINEETLKEYSNKSEPKRNRIGFIRDSE